jgi:Fur family zinc uptake transcriptional regulator/Fur family ferric uptake transcriptional regulator
MNDQYEQEAARKGFTITGHVFEFYGLCQDCQHKKNSSK